MLFRSLFGRQLGLRRRKGAQRLFASGLFVALLRGERRGRVRDRRLGRFLLCGGQQLIDRVVLSLGGRTALALGQQLIHIVGSRGDDLLLRAALVVQQFVDECVVMLDRRFHGDGSLFDLDLVG